MKTKIFFILTFGAVLCFSEIKAQDTLWTRATGKGTFTLNGKNVLWYKGQNQTQLLAADSGRVIWTDTTDLGGSRMTPDSLHFFGSVVDTVVFRRLSDGAIVKKYDTLITNNYPPHTSLSWYFTSYTFSRDGRYLFLTTTDRTVPNTPDNFLNAMIYKIDIQTDQLVCLKKLTACYIFRAAANDSFLICETTKSIDFFSLDSLNFVKSYRDTCTMALSKSGRYITTSYIYGNLRTWDTQSDSIVKKSKLDSINGLSYLQYTNNDSIVYILYYVNKVEHFLKYNLFTEERLNDFIFDLDFEYSIGSFELSSDDTKLLANVEFGGVCVYGLTSQPTAKKDDNNQRTIIRIIPNPTPGTTEIELTLEQNEKVNITLYDSSGKFVLDLGEKFFDVGINRFSFSTKKLPNGSYFVNIKSNRLNQTQKLIIEK